MSAVVFDLDGTLIDSAPDLHAAANRMLDEAGASPLGLAELVRFIGNGVPKLVERAMAARSLPIEDHPACLDRFMAYYDADPVTLTTIMPGVPHALTTLRTSGVPMAICTNKPEASTHAVLNALGLAEFFDAVVGGDALPVKKPDPAPLLRAAGLLAQDHTVFVGDSEVDAETATRAGVGFLLFTEGYRKEPIEALPHDAAFSHFEALPRLLADLTPPRVRG